MAQDLRVFVIDDDPLVVATLGQLFPFVSPAIWEQNRLTASLGLCAICDF